MFEVCQQVLMTFIGRCLPSHDQLMLYQRVVSGASVGGKPTGPPLTWW